MRIAFKNLHIIPNAKCQSPKEVQSTNIRKCFDIESFDIPLAFEL
jgi:hypothetical protein